MTALRSLAVRISSAVVHWASPGCKEWAEGLARELAFIPGDWRALGWALGSTRILLDRREASIASLAEAFEAAQKFFDKRSSQSLAGGLVIVFGSFAIGAFIVSAPSLGFGTPQTRGVQIGLFILLASILYGGYRAYCSRELDHPLDRYEAVVRYRDALRRDHKSQHGWPYRLSNLANFSIFIVLCAFVGRREFEEFFLHFPGVLLLLQFPFGEVQSRLKDRRNVRRIANLNALLSGARSGGDEVQ